MKNGWKSPTLMIPKLCCNFYENRTFSTWKDPAKRASVVHVQFCDDIQVGENLIFFLKFFGKCFWKFFFEFFDFFSLFFLIFFSQIEKLTLQAKTLNQFLPVLPYSSFVMESKFWQRVTWQKNFPSWLKISPQTLLHSAVSAPLEWWLKLPQRKSRKELKNAFRETFADVRATGQLSEPVRIAKLILKI